MLVNISLPPEMSNFIGSEITEFAVKSKRAYPPKTSLILIIFGAFWLGITLILMFVFLGPFFQGKEVQFMVNDVPTVAGPGNLRPILVPALIIGLFVLIGFGLLGSGLYLLFKKGGYFVGTPIRLISFQKGKYRSVDWEQFSGDIEVSGNDINGTITLGMRTGKMVSSKNGPDRYVPDMYYISGIPDAFAIEQICRKRIKENDPTPSAG
jgi:hypothetical protein